MKLNPSLLARENGTVRMGAKPVEGAPPFRPARASAGYVPEVDALRALAMTSVIIFHCKLMPFGWMGVWIFYVVSGFSVATSLFGGQHRAAGAGASIAAFYVRRALRIWPLYFTFVALNIVVLVSLGRSGPLEEVPWLLTFTYNMKMIFTAYTPDIGWPSFGHLWTISVEQQFYLVFPLLLLLSGRSARGLCLIGLIVSAPLMRAGFGHLAAGWGWDPERCAFAVYAFAPAHFDAFAIGALIALFRPEISADRGISRMTMLLATSVIAVYIGVYATLGVMRTGHLSSEAMRNIVSGIMYGQEREIFGYYVPIGISATILTGILSGAPGWLRVGRLPGLQAIGRVSYGGYLFHIPVLTVLGTFVPAFGGPANTLRGIIAHVGLFVCAYCITVALAWLSFTFFEQRIARLGRQRR